MQNIFFQISSNTTASIVGCLFFLIILIIQILFIVQIIKAKSLLKKLLFLAIAILWLLFFISLPMFGSMPNAESKDARIEADMEQLRTEGALYKLKNNSYGNTQDNFTTSGDGLLLINDINGLIKEAKNPIMINILPDKYCIQTRLNQGKEETIFNFLGFEWYKKEHAYWCIDSLGNLSGGNVNCNNITFTCK